jgi:hypothetical protein
MDQGGTTRPHRHSSSLPANQSSDPTDPKGTRKPCSSIRSQYQIFRTVLSAGIRGSEFRNVPHSQCRLLLCEPCSWGNPPRAGLRPRCRASRSQINSGRMDPFLPVLDSCGQTLSLTGTFELRCGLTDPHLNPKLARNEDRKADYALIIPPPLATLRINPRE